ncbi:WD40 repeat-like protein [Athelia psychrophila]|uniref:WD40 repeat-like protein n=1 Tax=Athelia psychrophila TaxID=1759441 RepID=A0A166THW1_9AGAM|nr:WD40 repeat-like protein [Fibularhizoctonia sp. CBS 109695]
MASYPHSHLFLRTDRAIVTTGPHAQILDAKTGEILHSTVNLDGVAKDAVLKTGPIRCAAVDAEGVHLVTSGDDKMLKVWRIDGLALLNSRELPKKPTGIEFTKDGQTLVVSDKFGDIFSYPLHPAPAPRIKRTRGALASHENPSGGALILGHASLMTAFALSADGRYVVSADRDEHVRVSWYPQGWNIESFCLGHEKYVTAVHIPAFAPGTMVSGGGDAVLKVWDWMTGKLKAEVEVWDTVRKFLLAKGFKKLRGQWGKKDEDGADDDVEQSGKSSRKERRMKNRVVKEHHISELATAEGDEQEGDIEGEGETDAKPTDAGELIQVIHKIQSFQSGPSQQIVFSAVGASALFMAALPSDGGTAASNSTRAYDFTRPVVDFTLDAEGIAWVLLDGGWGENTEAVPLVKRIQCNPEGNVRNILDIWRVAH